MRDRFFASWAEVHLAKGQGPAKDREIHIERSHSLAEVLFVTPDEARNGPATAHANHYGQLATLGTDLVIVVYIMANLGLPFFYRRHAPQLFSWWRHLAVPFLATALLAYPFWETIKPNQAAPLNWWWVVVVAILGFGAAGGVLTARRSLPVGSYDSLQTPSAQQGPNAGPATE
ncbi:MAG: hypothetical protein ACYDH5_09655 [Acidimicrobiales bacterium]